MTLVAVSYAYPPLRYPRSIQVARLLAQLSLDTVVVCGEEPGEGDRTLLTAYPDGERRVVRVPWSGASRAFATARWRILGDRLLVPDRYRPWQRDAARALRRLRRPVSDDVLVTFGQPMSDHLLGLRLARRTRARWIAHLSDPWVDSPFRQAGRTTHALNARLESAVVARADALVFTSAETVELVLAKYDAGIRAKAHVLPHAFDERLYPPALPAGDDLVVRYLGAFYGPRGPEPLLDALRAQLGSDPEVLRGVRFELVGTQEHQLSSDELTGLPAGLLRLLPPVPYLESLALMRQSDVLLVLDTPADHSVFLPSKLVDYVGARRPIVALTPPGPAAALVRRVGGWHADPRVPNDGARALAAALAAARSSRDREFGVEAVAREYSMGRVGASFASLVEAARRS